MTQSTRTSSQHGNFPGDLPQKYDPGDFLPFGGWFSWKLCRKVDLCGGEGLMGNKRGCLLKEGVP